MNVCRWYISTLQSFFCATYADAEETKCDSVRFTRGLPPESGEFRFHWQWNLLSYYDTAVLTFFGHQWSWAGMLSISRCEHQFFFISISGFFFAYADAEEWICLCWCWRMNIVYIHTYVPRNRILTRSNFIRTKTKKISNSIAFVDSPAGGWPSRSASRLNFDWPRPHATHADAEEEIWHQCHI